MSSRGMIRTTIALGMAFALAAPLTANAQGRRAFALAAAFTGIQLIATFAVHFPIGSSAQGRYLFPVIVPFLALVVAGYSSISFTRRTDARLAVPVLVAAACDVIGWTLVIVPAYG